MDLSKLDSASANANAIESHSRGFSRRQVLKAGAGAGMTLAAIGTPVGRALAESTPSPARLDFNFDEGWSFFRGDPAGAQKPSFNDRSWRIVDAPHDWRIENLPTATSTDGAASDDPSAFAYFGSTSDPTPPADIGPFDENFYPPTKPVFGSGEVPGGRAMAYTVGDVGWYRKSLPLTLATRQRAELLFDGILGRADVYINGTHLGFHPNSYCPFYYDLTPYLKANGANVIAIRVDNTGLTSRWYPGSGLYRHVQLTITGSTRIPRWGVAITTPAVSAAQSTVAASVPVDNNGADPVSAQVRLTALGAKGRAVASTTLAAQTIQPGATGSFSGSVAISPAKLWSAATPYVYGMQTDVLVSGKVVDTTVDTFGIRSIAWSGAAGLQINGETVKILGGNAHLDHGPLGVAAIDRAEKRQITRMQSVGFNALRTSHNPRSEYMLDICDETGMLVWDEFSDVWEIAKTADDYSNYFADYWQQDLTNMVMRDRNHPSVLVWSLGNEISTNPSNNYGPQLKALVQSLDPTRAITVGGTPSELAIEDVLDVHYGEGVESGVAGPPPSTSNSIITTHQTNTALAVTQSESLPSTIYDDYQLAQENVWFVGSWAWSAWDYLGESGIGGAIVADNLADADTDEIEDAVGVVPYPWFQSFCGDLDLIGQRKPQNYLRAAVTGTSPAEMFVLRPAPAGLQQFQVGWAYFDELRSWTWDVDEGQDMTVHVYTPGDSVTLKLNGKKVGTVAVTAADRCIATFTVPYSPGELSAVAHRNGTAIGQAKLKTVGAAAALRLKSDVQKLSTSRGDLAHVLVEIVDANGALVPDAVSQISFGTFGAGDLIGVANANPHNVDGFQQTQRYTWHGQALAVVRPSKSPGEVTLTASSSGLQSASLTLPVKYAKAPAAMESALSRRSVLSTLLRDPLHRGA